MDTSKDDDQDLLKRALDLFLKAKQDEHSVTEVEQPLQIHIVGSQAYIPSYTRSVMDKNFKAPVMAIHTRTEVDSKTVFIYPAKSPDSRGAKRLRSTESMGPAYVAFGVPLRKIGIKLSITRRVILSLNILEVPNEGTVYWASFADIEKQRRHIDVVAIASAKQEKVAKVKARKESRVKRSADTAPTETSNS